MKNDDTESQVAYLNDKLDKLFKECNEDGIAPHILAIALVHSGVANALWAFGEEGANKVLDIAVAKARQDVAEMKSQNQIEEDENESI